MLMNLSKKMVLILVLCGLASSFLIAFDQQEPNGLDNAESVEQFLDDEQLASDASNLSDDTNEPQPINGRVIRSIKVIGNNLTPLQAIELYFPYRVGELFDQLKTRSFITSLYTELNRFAHVALQGVPVEDNQADLYLIVREKEFIKDVLFKGNYKLSTTEIKKKIDFDFSTIEDAELKIYAGRIKKLYREKGYTDAAIEGVLERDPIDNKSVLTFNISEGAVSLVKQINFVGNKIADGKELRSVLFTKEDWLLSFLDGAGTYHPDRLDGDKYMLEQFYQNRGFLQAQITRIAVDSDPCTKNITLTFYIDEGCCYVIDRVEIAENDLMSTDCLLSVLPVKAGDLYSKERIIEAIKALETLCGDFGYIFAQVTPLPRVDEETKTVTITFSFELGEKIFLNRVNIRGNKKTRDKVIRRQLVVQEGALLLQTHMDISKQNVESLGYFEPRDGVNWKIHRIGNNEADLDLMVHEAKTGSFNIQAGFGGSGADIRSPATGLSFKGVLADSNLFGKGINFSVEGSWAHEEQTIVLHLAQQWLYDKPFSGAFDLYHRRPTYDDLHHVLPRVINEKLTGFGLTLGLITRQLPMFGEVQFLTTVGLDAVHYENRPRANINTPIPGTNEQYQQVLDREFVSGKFAWFSYTLEQNRINHPMHASRGHKWKLLSRIAVPSFGDSIGFYKINFDYHWFTPLIGEYDLVFHFHSFLGLVGPFKNKTVPFGELFHIGGQSSVRGFLFGQIGPQFYNDSIGAKKAFYFNTELIFPITPDLNMKGVVFYDAGAGWDNPYAHFITVPGLKSNSFEGRHSIGFGIRLLNPTPIRIDVGYKLGARRDRVDAQNSETDYEIHFGMNYSW